MRRAGGRDRSGETEMRERRREKREACRSWG